MVITGKKINGEAKAQKVKRVETKGNLAQVNEEGILEEGKPILRGSQDGEKDRDAAERHQRIPDHASGQPRYGIEQAAIASNKHPLPVGFSWRATLPRTAHFTVQ